MRLPTFICYPFSKPQQEIQQKTCLTCGFLCKFLAHTVPDMQVPPYSSPTDTVQWWQFWGRNVELAATERPPILIPQQQLDRKPLNCARNIWVPDSPAIKNLTDDDFRSFLLQPRYCNYFLLHSPGLDPQQHLDLQREYNTNQFFRNMNIRTTKIMAIAVLGAAAITAIISVLVAVFAD